MSQRIHISDVVLRDGHQSLIATRMRTEDMLPICEKLDQAGFWSLEVWGGATFDACVRFLKEDPWQRLQQLRKALPNTRLQMLLRGQNLLGYRHYSDDVVEAFISEAAAQGIDVFRVFDALNDTRNLETAIKAVKNANKHAQGTICYTTSPVHTIDTFTEQARVLTQMGCDSIAIKDMAGLLNPQVTYDLVSALKAESNVPIFLHAHDTSGMSAMCHLKALEAGCDHIDTCISAFAGGTSHAPTETMVVALSESGYTTGLDLDVLQEISTYFREVRKKYHQFESDYNGVDVNVLINQVPGGMMSNLANQLKEQGALERIQEVFEEIPRVRKDLGFPPLVTPSSQIVGTQAVLNVVTGKRYETITNEVKRYLQGWYGKAPSIVSAELRTQAIGNEDTITCRPADLLNNEMEKLSTDIGDLAENPADVLTYAMFPDIGRAFLEQRKAGELKPEPLLPAKGAQEPSGIASEFKITLHGESYDIHVTGTSPVDQGTRRFYMTVDGVPEEIYLETKGEFAQSQTQGGQRPLATEEGHVTTTMPGNILEVMVNVGDTVNVGDPVLIIEAMKMETEIKATSSGTVKAIYVEKGNRVTPSEILLEIA